MTDLLRLATMERCNLSTLSQLSVNDIAHVWAEVSAYIESQMALQKGVHVAGLGTFTFSQVKLDFGNKSSMIQRPIFMLCGKLQHTLGLKQARPLAAATHLPVVPLNFTAVSNATPFSRNRVEGCVRETLLLLVRTVASQQNVLLLFPGIGVLSFKNNKVQMKFSKDFINAMDGTGSLLLAFKQRPGSSASLTSAGSRLQRPQTVNFTTLPTVHSPELQSRPENRNVQPDQPHAAGISQQTEQKSHWTPQAANTNEVNLKPHEDRQKPLTSPMETLPKMAEPPVGCSGHTRAGQELCYLCMQRANRNVPVYLREQEEAEERVLEKVLLLRALNKDSLFYEKEQAKLAEQREHAREVASFNLCMSAKKDTHYPRCPTSFIFPSRPLTPAPRINQRWYKSELQTQIVRKQQKEAQEKQDRERSECIEQTQLLQELASFRAQQLKQKREMTANYKKALDSQERKPPGTDQC
uniref:Coiled-coil domain-containing protein 81 n=1 Tax=Neogobius melanostomus TaxID=47308 RepID=A0A8C6T9V2_9GOBI